MALEQLYYIVLDKWDTYMSKRKHTTIKFNYAKPFNIGTIDTVVGRCRSHFGELL